MSVIDYIIVAAIYFGGGYVLYFKWTQGVKPKYNIMWYIASTVLALFVFNLIK